MLKIGQYNTLQVSRLVDFGAYLDGGNGQEVLLPARYIEHPLTEGESLSVFVYTDSEDRPVATTEHPYATVGEFAFLDVVSVDRIGAFLNWGLMKDLLVPFSQQKSRMVSGGRYLVYVYLDDATKRVVASAKIEKFLGNVIPRYKTGDATDVLVYRETPIGYACIVDNLHQGMIYANQVFRPISVGDRLEAYVRRVRPDGKIDLMLSGAVSERTNDLSDVILDHLRVHGGYTEFDDHSSPEVIKEAFYCSKRDFKRAVGHLLKCGKIRKEDRGLSLLDG